MKKGTSDPSDGLESFSEEHFEVLSFGWKIAEGLRNNIETERLKAYADWFFENYMRPHIEIEKKYLFPIVGLKNFRIKKALANHRRLLRLFKDTKDVYRSLNRIEDEIGRYVRFEERVLYKQIQEKATPEELEKVDQMYKNINFSGEKWKDPFWTEK